MHCGKKIVTWDRPVVMGILNVTPDSFHDGGHYLKPETWVQRAQQIMDEGGDIIDIGVVSTRPGATLPSPEEESERLAEVVRRVREALPEAILSVDTCHSLPARKAVEAGADIVNDISGGLFDPEMWDCVAEMDVTYILGHTRGLPNEMQNNTHYDNLIEELTQYFSRALDTLYRKGVKDIILDPCFGFAKSLEQNYDLLSRLEELTGLFRQPVLAGISRKSMIYNLLQCTHEETLNGTAVLNTVALMKGVRMLRVHDVRQAREAVTLVTQL